jgi:hypothetical protein
VESYAGGSMDEYGMTVFVQTDSYRALTDVSMTHMTSLTQILLGYLFTNIASTLSLNSHLLMQIEHVNSVFA